MDVLRKKLKVLLLLVIVSVFSATSAEALQKICFSPSSCCENNIAELAKDTKKTIDVAIYSFTNNKIYEAILEAKNRGVLVRVVTDKVQSKGKYSLIKKLIQSGIEVRINNRFNIEHNKFGVFDDFALITGSYNWTTNATLYNSENCIVETQGDIIKKYKERFEELWKFYGEPTKKARKRCQKKARKGH